MRKSVGLLLLMIIALSITGIAYSQWSVSMSAAGTVQTGTIGLDITSGAASMTVTDAQPGEEYSQVFTVRNTGSVTLKLPKGNTGVHIDETARLSSVSWEFTSPLPPLDDQFVLLAPQGEASLAITVTVDSQAEWSKEYGFTVTIDGRQTNDGSWSDSILIAGTVEMDDPPLPDKDLRITGYTGALDEPIKYVPSLDPSRKVLTM